ncbi:MAG TPA: L-serine ammonia-lyase [Candidatus Acidoferrum sp.]|nr:L-serine ammonia-lyase [Candidatus Acidoferrum sp.]
MKTSLFELFKIGIGPSSSHTVGPMRAAGRFVRQLAGNGLLERTARVRVELFGSLALTGMGHGTDRGIMLGLLGKQPEAVDPAAIQSTVETIRRSQSIALLGTHAVIFRNEDLVWNKAALLPGHSNGMRFTALDANGGTLDVRDYYSIGGGFVREEGQEDSGENKTPVPYPFRSAAELLELGEKHQLKVHDLMHANEKTWRTEEEINHGIARIWQAMQDCVSRGMVSEGELPGGLQVQRRAPAIARRLAQESPDDKFGDPLQAVDWLNVWAIATNEENAAGSRVVTAPTNGAAGIIPSVAHYYMRFFQGTDEGIARYFLAAAAIGVLYKENASISGAEVGCQGEVGVACSMAAAGLVAALEGSNGAMEHAAEIAMEHNLGMTCDPVGGLVQIPCIERNAFGAVKAVNAARMAMQETTEHKVSLDQVIKTMYQTGLDMQTRYKETSLGGLALNVIEC